MENVTSLQVLGTDMVVRDTRVEVGERSELFPLPAAQTEALSLLCEMEVRVFLHRAFVMMKLYNIEAMSNTP